MEDSITRCIMDEGKVKCFRLVSIFVVAGFLCASVFTRITWPNFISDTLIILLSVILLFFLVDWCWRPFISLECSSESAPTEDVAGPSEPSTPLVHAEEPPSYDQVILQDQQSSVLSWVGPQGSRQQQEDLAEAGASEDQSHVSIHGISYDYSNSTYSSANEIQLSVDGLPSYNDVVAAMQDTTRPRTETGSGDGYSMLFI
ncbi:uncharacterized protein LOC122255874 [Penaeus japonicus]|uniref:uncharacterized protein LOC122255874 n=1 Tax=Penaeus japonicus TaxID=27405 RepID=UPI001C71275E|nr:uncharacterized protein LOC122255874 [Penaeus japonicus]XP_042876170.1 uncharacterized protein LOC122255874 [Penaeus japonicus]XP_042876177.1 uncharacterized protein LOC122255874 [Penaeus japonicus]